MEDKTYGDLYLYLEKKFSRRTKREKREAFFLTKNFLEKHHIVNPSRVIQVLSDFGAAGDLEVLFNVSWRIPEETKLIEDIETPVEYALRNGYYTRWHEGMWVSCTAEATDCHPDINKAYEKMKQFKPNDKGKKDES